VPVYVRSANIAVEVTGGNFDAECTKGSSIKGELKAFRALFERRFTLAPLSE